MNITEFLEARIAEDEKVAREVESDFQFDPSEPLASPLDVFEESYDAYPVISISRTRVLAECAAKRAILADHNEEMTHWWPEMVEVQVCGRCGDGTTVEWPCPTIAALAAVYKDHPDYRQEWAVG